MNSGDGTLTQSELYNVLDEGCREDKMGFDEERIDSLTQIVWEEAVGSKAVMTLPEFKAVLNQYPNLVKGLKNRYSIYNFSFLFYELNNIIFSNVT